MTNENELNKNFNVPSWWNQANKQLSKCDKLLGKVIKSNGSETLLLRKQPFNSLARSIVGQQISVKAAASIWKNLEKSIQTISIESIKDADHNLLMSCGLSKRKSEYLHNLAIGLENRKEVSDWCKYSNIEVIQKLTSIKGIGKWTAEMFLIFCLGRQDIFPTGDLGLLNALGKLHGTERPSPSEAEELGNVWRPWRTAATWHLWRSIDPIPINY